MSTYSSFLTTRSGWQGEEGAMKEIFNKARQLAPSVIVFEGHSFIVTLKPMRLTELLKTLTRSSTTKIDPISSIKSTAYLEMMA
jgi:hypothetical protein